VSGGGIVKTPFGLAADTICEAIKARRILSFAYKASDRTAEPYILGYDDKGKLVLSAVQLTGGSGGGFRSFELAGMSAVAATDRHFSGTDRDYNPDDPYFERIICQV